MRAALFLAGGLSSPIGVVSQSHIEDSSTSDIRVKFDMMEEQGKYIMWPWETHTLRFN